MDLGFDGLEGAIVALRGMVDDKKATDSGSFGNFDRFRPSAVSPAVVFDDGFRRELAVKKKNVSGFGKRAEAKKIGPFGVRRFMPFDIGGKDH